MKTAYAVLLSNSNIIDALKLVLADTYALCAATQNAHWNVEGTDFFELHQAFGGQYESLFDAVDELAERMRQLGSYAPANLAALSQLANIQQVTPPATQNDFVNNLISGHEKTAADLLVLQKLCSGDLQTQDLTIKRLEEHQKTLWMLRSYVKA